VWKWAMLLVVSSFMILSGCSDNSDASTSNIQPIEENQNFTFRKTTWGMSQEEVKKSESLVPSEKDSFLSYKDSINGLDATLSYAFVDDKLAKAMYSIKETHTNKNDYISDYKDLKKLLTEKYGEPFEDNEIWSKSLYKNDPEEYGLAVSLGHLNYLTQWETEDTVVNLVLFGENYKITHTIMYESKNYSGEYDEKRKNTHKDKL
jgi:predicted RND superfamily exporter protein